MPRYPFSPFHTLIFSKRESRPLYLMTRRHRSYKAHSWTEEELNLVCYLRSIRHWRFTQIQKVEFPLLSRHAVGGAYRKLPPEERTRRALAAASTIARSRHTARHKSPYQAQAAFSNPEQGPSPLHSTNTEIGHAQLTSSDNNSTRYSLRPNRPTTFLERKPRYTVDRVRFPHFFESYSRYLKASELPDSEYVPPSHTPTPSSSVRSPSVISSIPSAASSLELFGLEARSLNSSDCDSSVISDLPNDGSSSEFFSPEEHLSTP
ncbi:hypothetical protein M752DRAFT_294761 [Aspergillus phoenicis ATCC 13157]|uniref:Uncharacterized protein n=1 Tax=Aspergillus phoenicis ATCC 13157 TaxID=1353007 RepID=A0A370PFY1_ASPPH|nr:hypothetical protein M752DRAFT_294761 [Aspergillus phoenicis ATCC 13157]